MISKELLGEVLNKEVSIWDKYEIKGNVLEIGIHLPSGGRFYKEVNIYELAHKCKEWAYENNYYIYSIFTFAGEGSAYITKDENISKHLSSFSGDYEPEAIFKACQWILDNKESK